ncbi:hypothetical protein FHX41_5110 [Actinomadura hallensis]|uniref:Uncharacterized protein n=1 Tax=Actinomadura hallensis TaxID=337895 RepID=A0A543IL87_9ACTN|nr:DUF6328 family protein [Actinomadura hallensis]TQM71345.1 hypothetical protein FHX41_5110 [Actinomadura hallensis]HLV75506.1 DUF6328 family protein [Vulgatibacteraceae bacterium]
MTTDPADKPRNETEFERLDRQLVELLQGFRVAVTGVQVLFAFLLIVPFSTHFDKVDDAGTPLFYVALFGAAVASICFIAPVFHHRILFRLGQKPLLIRRANMFGIIGAFALMASMTASTTLIVQSVSGETAWTIVTAAALLMLCGWAWFLQPYLSRRRASRLRQRKDG